MQVKTRRDIENDKFLGIPTQGIPGPDQNKLPEMPIPGSVAAKVLIDVDGSVVYDSTGKPMLAPEDFDPRSFVTTVQSSRIGIFGFEPNGPFDLQRSYDGQIGTGGAGFVPSFRPIGSWAYGYAAAALGYSEYETLAGAGAINLMWSTPATAFNNTLNWTSNTYPDISGPYFSPPQNDINISAGFEAYIAANPYSITTGFAVAGAFMPGIAIAPLAHLTGYTGPFTGYSTPAERGPGPGENEGFDEGDRARAAQSMGIGPYGSPDTQQSSGSYYDPSGITSSYSYTNPYSNSYDADIASPSLGIGTGSATDFGPYVGSQIPMASADTLDAVSSTGLYSGPVSVSVAQTTPPTPVQPQYAPLPYYGPTPEARPDFSIAMSQFGPALGTFVAGALPTMEAAAAGFFSGVFGFLGAFADAFSDDDDGDDDDGGDDGEPVLLDLSGKGLSVNTLTTSSQFVNVNGDGYQHRTAWAGNGTGVLVFDADGDGKISNSKEFEFTQWDPAATGDLDAIKNVFDTNGNGKLDAGDAQWAKFKIMVNGQLVSLSSLGITSIDLTPKGSGQTFSDGSAITGTTSYTKSDGTTGAVGDAVLASDSNGYIVKSTVVTNADQSTTNTIQAYNANGSLAFQNLVTTSADGNSVSTKFDDDGNGTYDRSQTDVTTFASGVRTRVVSDFSADGSLVDRTTTVTSADLKSVTTTVDQDGDGNADQSQIFVTNADGTSTTTTKEFSASGVLLQQKIVQSSADGLTKTTKTDANGDGVYEAVTTDTTVVASDGSRSRTVTDTSANGTLLSSVITLTSADGHTRTVTSDLDGNGTVDQRDQTQRTIASNGDVTTVVTTSNGDNSLRGKVTTVAAANGLSTTTSSDLTGDGVVDDVHSDVTTVGSDGSRTETVQDTSASGVLLSKSVTVTGADGKSKNISADANGDGAVDNQTAITVASDGTITKTDSTLNPNGTLVSKVLTTTSADGLSKTVSTDTNGDGAYDAVTSDVITAGTGGARVETVTKKSGNGTVLGQTLTTTSADSLTQTVQSDLNGDGSFDKAVSDVIVLNAGARTETVTAKSGNGTLLSQTVTTVSADRKTTSVTKDVDGDGHIDSASTEIIAADGSQATTTIQAGNDGSLHRKTVVTVSADKLTTTTSDDLNGDGTVDVTTVDQTVINADGSRTETVTDKSNTGALLDKVTTITSGNGLTVTVQKDVNGDGIVDAKTVTATVLNNNGSKTTIASDYAGTSLTDQTTVTTSANGLVTKTDHDYDGSGNVDRTETATKTLNADGSTSLVDTVTTASGALLSKTTNTATSDGKTVTSQVDLDGDGTLDAKTTTVIDATGQTTKTVETYKAGTTTLASRAITTTSANGLSVTTSSDLDGDGVYEQMTNDVTTLNADGSKTETISRFGTGSTLISRTTTTTSGNGLSKQTAWTDGTGATLRSSNDVTTLGADGSTTEVVTNTGAISNKTTTTTSGDGKTVTVTYDIDGNGVVDQKSVTVKNADGSVTRTLSDLTSAGAVSHSETITKGADGLSQLASYDTDGNGAANKTVTDLTTLNTNGSKTTVEKVYVANSGGTLVQNATTQTDTSADGLTVTTRWDQTGSGTFAKSRTDITVLNADGSRTQTVSYFIGTTLTSRYLTTTSANGLSITSQSDATGAGTYAQTSADVTVINVDGTKTRTVSSTKADGSLISKFVTTTNADGLIVSTSEQRTGLAAQTVSDTVETLADGAKRETMTTTDASGKLLDKTITLTSADKQTVTIDRDANGDGVIDQHQQTVRADSGVTTQIVTDYKSAGVKADGSTSTTTPDGLQTTTDWDLDGNGTVDRRRVTVNTNNADGSKLSVISDTDLTINKLVAKTTIQQSSDGLVRTTSKDVDGDGTVDQVETLTADTTGATVSIVTNNATAQKANYLLAGKVYWKQAIAATVETDSSADGRTKTVKYDYDGNGTFEVVMQSQLQVDGSTVALVTETNASGAVVAKGTITTSADGLITVLSKDSNNDGVIDHTETSVIHNDGSTTLTKVDLNAGSAVTQTVVDTVSAMGSLTLRVTSNGQGQMTSQFAIAGDGSSVTTTYNAAGGQVLSIVNANKAGILTTAVLYDPLNANPWSRVEQTYNATGKETLEQQFNDDGTRTEITFDADNTQPWSRFVYMFDTAGRLTNQIEYNDDGTEVTETYDAANTQPWSRIEQSIDASGRLTAQSQYNDDGSRLATTYDVTHVQPWSHIEQLFDSSGRLVAQSQYIYNGTRIATTYDAANTQPWSRIEQLFDSAGNLLAQSVYDDNGVVIPPSSGAPHFSHNPVLLDLNGDGHIDLRPFDAGALAAWSGPHFDWNGDGTRDGTAWVGPQDGFLAIDLGENGQAGPDGKIDQAKELAFSEWATPEQVAANGGSVSDLDGLRLAFDSNHDNVLDASDDRWSEFRVWRDANQNGVVDDGELQTMSQAGIKLINLLPTPEGSQSFADGSAITGTSSYQTTDGTSHYLVGDATLSYLPADPKQNAA